MIGIPERFARACAKAPISQKRGACGSAREAKLPGGGDGVNAAIGADAAIALEYGFAEITGLGSQLPLVNAEFRAKSEAPFRDLQRTPAAEPAAIRTARNRFAVDPATLHGAHRAHRSFLNQASSLRGLNRPESTKFDTLSVYRDRWQRRRNSAHQTARGPRAVNGSGRRFVKTGYRVREFRPSNAARDGGGGAR
jgi:hypothetical protein